MRRRLQRHPGSRGFADARFDRANSRPQSPRRIFDKGQPGAPPVGLWLRLTKVVCASAVQVTTAGLEVTALLIAVADALSVSTPVKIPS